MQAMILAAGFGTRLLPYTQILPKPLFPLLNEPLLLLTIRRLQAAGFDHIIVNCHYLREQIVTALTGVSGVVVQEEETILGTGGGLRFALSHMRNEPLLVTNGDIYHTLSYRNLYHAHDAEKAVVTMAMHCYPRFNKVTVLDGYVIGFDDVSDTNARLLAFTGLHVLEPDVLADIPQGEKSSIIDRYRELLKEGETIASWKADGCFWTDMGTVDDYLKLHGGLLKQEIPLWEEFSNRPEDSFFVDERASVGKGAIFQDWACVGQAQLPPDCALQRCVVWDNVTVEQKAKYSDMLLAPALR